MTLEWPKNAQRNGIQLERCNEDWETFSVMQELLPRVFICIAATQSSSCAHPSLSTCTRSSWIQELATNKTTWKADSRSSVNRIAERERRRETPSERETASERDRDGDGKGDIERKKEKERERERRKRETERERVRGDACPPRSHKSGSLSKPAKLQPNISRWSFMAKQTRGWLREGR